ncbi:MAG: response regulator [bacterium]|jgi:DNA-binding NtrC family response regulator
MHRILVIDDEEQILNALRRRLERAGYDVTTAGDEAGAIRTILSETPFDAVVTDMSMDDAESGLRVLQAAISRDLFAEVIVLTAYGNVANAVECMRRGAFDYLEKNIPGVDVYELLTMKVEQAVDRRREAVRTVEKWERLAAEKQVK